MATTIKLKNGSGAPLAGDLVQGEPALDLTNKRLYTEDSGGTVIEVGTNPTSLTTGTFTSTGIDDNATSTAITIDSSQRVGIGTSSPFGELSIKSASPQVYLETVANGNVQINFNETADQLDVMVNNSNGKIAFGTNSAERMRIDSSGNVGIGTASPNSYANYTTLTLRGTTGSEVDFENSSGTVIGAIYNNATDLVIASDFTNAVSSSNVVFTCDGTERMRIDSSGNVGIGTTTPNSAGLGANGQTLQLGTRTFIATESGGDTRLGGLSGSNFTAFYQGGTERARIDVNGNLLVGKTSSSITTAGTEITSSSLLQSVSDTSTNLATNGGAALNLCNTSATNGNFSNIGGYNSNGLVVSQMNFINLNHASRTGAITLSTHDGTSLNEAMRIDSSGRVGIGTTSPNAKLTVDGQGAFGSADASGNGIYLYVSGALSDNSYMSRSSSGTGTTTWYIGNQSITTSSDVRLKDNIVDSERNAVEIINNLRVVDHTWNDPSDQSVNNKNSRGVWTGLIAQEAVEHIPWLVNRPLEDVDENGYENYWHMDYGYAVPLLIKAIQEQQAMIEILQAEVAALKGA